MVIVAYVPALHRGYLQFFNQYKGRARTLYLLNEEVLADFPKSAREIRSIDAENMQRLLANGGFFEEVIIAGKKELSDLAKQKKLEIIVPNELICQEISKAYFAQSNVKFDQLFLRYDEATVAKARKEIPFTGKITARQFDRHVLDLIEEEKEKSSDHFLRLAAAIIVNKKIIAIRHNQRMPSPHDSWLTGDPRNFMEYGTNTHLRASLHAEQAVIAVCASEGIRTKDASLYVCTFPCPDCSQLIAACGFSKLYFKDGYSQLSASETLTHYGVEIFQITSN